MADDHSRLSLDTVLCPAEGLDFVLVSDNELLVQFGTRSRPSELFRDNDLSGAIGSVVRALQSGSSTLGEVLLSLPHEQRDEARQLIDSLVEQGVISEAARDPVQQYIRYTFTGESSISGSRVALIGAGPIGARIARNLLQQGIARLWLADSRLTDTIWQGSALFGAPQPADLGRPAQMVLAEHLRSSHENVEALEWADGSAVEVGVANADLVVLALEQPDMQLSHAVNRACIGAGKPWLSAVIDGNRGLIGPLFSPPDTACYNDYQLLARAAMPSGAMARKHRQHVLANGRTSFATGLPGYADIVAGHCAIAAAHFLIRGASHLLGRVMTVDFDGMQIDVEDVLKLPRCPVCATRRIAYRPPFPEYMDQAV